MPRPLSNTDPALRRCRHPEAPGEQVMEQPHDMMLLGEPWVLHRADGQLRPHRRRPLSFGRCEDGVVVP